MFITTNKNLFVPENLVQAVNEHRKQMEEANINCKRYAKEYTEEELFNLYLSDYLMKFSFKMTEKG